MYWHGLDAVNNDHALFTFMEQLLTKEREKLKKQCKSKVCLEHGYILLYFSPQSPGCIVKVSLLRWTLSLM